MSITEETLRLAAQLRTEINSITDNQLRDMAKIWSEAWGEIAAELNDVLLDLMASGDVTFTQALRSLRLQRAMRHITDLLEEVVGYSQERIVQDLEAVIDISGATQAALIATQLPSGAGIDLGAWARASAAQVAAISKRVTEQITASSKPISAETAAAIRASLFRGIVVGDNPRAVARDMVARTRQQFSGGLNRAMVISRTEMLDAHRAGAQVGRRQFAELLEGWLWLATLDLRTCRSCWAQHGTFHELEEFGPIDHPQGRCGSIPSVKPWSELGLDVVEPPSLMPDAEQVFNQLNPSEQRRILGPKGYAAWNEGRFPMDQWSALRHSEEWRDYRVAAPVPN